MGSMSMGQPVEGVTIHGAPGTDQYVRLLRVAFAAGGVEVSVGAEDSGLDHNTARLIVGHKPS